MLVVIDVVGLSGNLLGEHTPNLNRLAGDGSRCTLGTVTPAVTCSAQSTFLTGTRLILLHHFHLSRRSYKFRGSDA
ncbi:MAG: alkaline phosphatase family protein [SAR324 cluster bacterium]|nr:alkaline phosphatase family protein [SAR324 cluster bacterium]